MRQALRTAAFLIFLAASLGVGLDASAQDTWTQELRWSHPNPSEVAGYRVYWGDSSGSYPNQVNVSNPSPDGTGAYVYDLQVASSTNIFVAVKAYNTDALESAFSNEKQFSQAIGEPGKPEIVLP